MLSAYIFESETLSSDLGWHTIPKSVSLAISPEPHFLQPLGLVFESSIASEYILHFSMQSLPSLVT